MQTQVIEIIETIIAERRRARRHPLNAMRLEITKRYDGTIVEMDKELARLVKNHEILEHQTANSTAYTLGIK